MGIDYVYQEAGVHRQRAPEQLICFDPNRRWRLQVAITYVFLMLNLSLIAEVKLLNV